MNKSAATFAFGCFVVLLIAVAGIVSIVAFADDTSERSGDIGFRAFVPVLQRDLDQKDLAFLGERMETTHIACGPEDLGGLGGPGSPACEFDGQEFDGFPIGRWQSEGGIFPALSILGQIGSLFDTQLPEAGDGFGDGGVRVYAIDLAPDKSHAIITALIERPPNFVAGGPLRVAVATAWSFTHGEWRFTSLLTAYVNGDDFLIPCPVALDYFDGTWERYPDPKATGPSEDRCTS